MRSTLRAAARCAFLVVAACLCAGMALASQPESPIQALVSKYRRGDNQSAMAEFLAWDAARVARQATLPADAPPADLAALALMHTAVAVARGTFGSGNRAPVLDKTNYPTAIALVNELSRRENTARDPGLRAFCRDWYIVAVSLWSASRNYRQAAAVVRDGLRRFGDDPESLLAAGSTAEGLMGPYASMLAAATYTAPTSAASVGGVATSGGYVTEDSRDAEKWLRKAVSLNPNLVEARLRLGRVLYHIDHFPQALKELEQALADATGSNHPFAAYLAALFLGDLLERTGQLDEARTAYEKAIALHPEYQSAYLALGHLLVTAGKPAEG